MLVTLLLPALERPGHIRTIFPNRAVGHAAITLCFHQEDFPVNSAEMGLWILEPRGHGSVPGESSPAAEAAYEPPSARVLANKMLPSGTTRYYDDPDRPQRVDSSSSPPPGLKCDKDGIILVSQRRCALVQVPFPF